MEELIICRYCGGPVHLVPADRVYGAAAHRLGIQDEQFYQCQRCFARVGCHKGTTHPMGNLANEALRQKRKAAHLAFDGFWKSRNMRRGEAYKWLSEQMQIPTAETHIGSFEIDQCKKVIEICRQADLHIAA